MENILEISIFSKWIIKMEFIFFGFASSSRGGGSNPFSSVSTSECNLQGRIYNTRSAERAKSQHHRQRQTPVEQKRRDEELLQWPAHT